MNMINHPPHYTSSNASCSHCGKPIECIDVTRHMGFNDGNVVKYVWRYALKAGVEDLKKALWYLQDLIARLEPPAPEAATTAYMAELTRELETNTNEYLEYLSGDAPGGSAGHETIRITEHDRI